MLHDAPPSCCSEPAASAVLVSGPSVTIEVISGLAIRLFVRMSYVRPFLRFSTKNRSSLPYPSSLQLRPVTHVVLHDPNPCSANLLQADLTTSRCRFRRNDSLPAHSKTFSATARANFRSNPFRSA